ncbi:MAG: nucleotidyl transferase AbiEii/AbiGii toxin family protein [Anaerolineae bacterium]
MSVSVAFYQRQLYPFQDAVLAVINRLETEFYLTGGTAVSRAYCQHRFSDDLDLFVNDHSSFSLWGERIIAALTHRPDWHCVVNQKDDRFMRLTLEKNRVLLKIDLVNDVPAHVGEIEYHPILGRVDSPENILANKLSAILSRGESKDLADIWALTHYLQLSITAAITNAQSKAAGIFPVALARILLNAEKADWEVIRWQSAPTVDEFLKDLHTLGESLILGGEV